MEKIGKHMYLSQVEFICPNLIFLHQNSAVGAVFCYFATPKIKTKLDNTALEVSMQVVTLTSTLLHLNHPVFSHGRIMLV